MTSSRLLSLFLVVLIVAGCATTSGGEEKASAREPAEIRRAYVFVDGEAKAVTPATVVVRRGFGARLITLQVGQETERIFELETSYNSTTADLAYSYWPDASPTNDATTLDVGVLSTKNDTLFYVPYSSSPIEVEDRKYGLTLIVRN